MIIVYLLRRICKPKYQVYRIADGWNITDYVDLYCFKINPHFITYNIKSFIFLLHKPLTPKYC